MKQEIKLGTRGSKLALAQAGIVKHRIESSCPGLHCHIVVIETEGDKDLTSPLCEIGGKGVFVKALEEALLNEHIDIGVHSLKDITSKPTSGLILCGFLEAESSADVLILKAPYHSLSSLPPNAVLATGSMRRKAALKKLRPDIQTVDIRGNVPTRLEKLNAEGFDGLVLSEAGLIRLDLTDKITQRFTPTEFCPAPGQGVITLQTRYDDILSLPTCIKVSNQVQLIKSTAELAFLEKVGFDCRTPLGVHTSLINGNLHFQVFLSTFDFSKFYEKIFIISMEGRLHQAQAAAEEVLRWIDRNES